MFGRKRVLKLQAVIRTQADQLRALKAELGQVYQAQLEAEERAAREKLDREKAQRAEERAAHENKMLREATASMQQQRDKYMSQSIKQAEELKYLNAVLDKLAARYDGEIISALISAPEL